MFFHGAAQLYVSALFFSCNLFEQEKVVDIKGGKRLDEYRTVAGDGADEFTEKRSRFIGCCRPVQTQEQALAFIEEKRKEHWNAAHNVYAYVLRGGFIERYSDDGEPQGTAGVPVLEVIKKSGVTDVCVVVTRYFGGVLLGAGGLVRAYSRGAKLALDCGGIVCVRLCKICRILCSYDRYGKIASLIPECGGVLEDTSFTDKVCIDFHMTAEELARLNTHLLDATCGEIQAEITGEAYFSEKDL